MEDLMEFSKIAKEFNLKKGEEITWFPIINVEIIKVKVKGRIRKFCKKEDFQKIKEFYTQDNLDEIKRKMIIDKRRKTCMERYGGPSPMHSKDIRNKVKNTFLERYGVDGIFKCEDIKQKRVQTYIKRYGVSNPMKSKIIQEKSKKTCLEKYGKEFYFQTQDSIDKSKKTKLERYGDINFNNREKTKETCMRKYGVDNVRKTEFVKNKSKETCMKKYGVPYQWQSENMRIKTKETCMRKYGVEHPSQTEISKKKAKETNLKKFGVEYPMQSNEILRKSHKKWHVKDFDNVSFASKEEGYFYIYLINHNYKFEYQVDYPIKYKDKSNNEHTFIVDFKIDNIFYEIKGNQFFDSKGNAQIIYNKQSDTYKKRLSLWESKLDFIRNQSDIVLINTNEFAKGGRFYYMKEYFIKNFEFIKNY